MSATRDRDRIAGILLRDPAWAAYAICDLNEDAFPYSQWYVSENALALLFSGFSPPILATFGDASESDRVLSEVPAPGLSEGNFRGAEEAAYRRYFKLERLVPVWRMLLGELRAVPGTAQALTTDHIADLQALYSTGGGDHFSPDQVRNGYFRGIRRDGQLVAVAGVHCVSPAYRVAAVGNVATHPDWRGQGLAAQATSTVCRDLQADGYRTIILNVEAANDTAVRLYSRLGFALHCAYTQANLLPIARA